MAKDDLARQQIKALDRRVTEGNAAQKEAIKDALAAAEKAVVKAEAASEKRFEGVNEFRQTLSDQAATFISRSEVESLLKGIASDVARLDNQGANDAGRSQGVRLSATTVYGAVGLLAAVIAILGGLSLLLPSRSGSGAPVYVGAVQPPAAKP